MKVSIGIGGAASGQRRDFDQLVEYVVEAEKLGVDTVWTAEAWGQDAIAQLAYLAPRTTRIRFGTGILQTCLGTSFTTEHAAAHLDYLRRGAEQAGRSLADIEIEVGGTVAFGDDLDALVEPLKPAMAFTLGAMGSATTNFYNDAFKRGGWEAAAREVQRLWIAGRRPEAIAKVPPEMVIQANLLGDTEMVRHRIRTFRDAGVTTLRVTPQGRDLAEKLATLGRMMDLVRC